MPEEEKREEPLKFTYKSSLDQPYWIQQITDNFAFRRAIRLSFFAYLFLFVILFYYTVGRWIPYFDWEIKLMFTIFISWRLAGVVSELRPADKLPPVFLWGLLTFQIRYGMRNIVIYKGQKYKKKQLRSVEEFMEDDK